MERSVKYFAGGLNPVSRRQPHPLFSVKFDSPGGKSFLNDLPPGVINFLNLTQFSISAPDFGSIGVVESAVAEEKDHADKIYKKLIYMIEEHHVSML